MSVPCKTCLEYRRGDHDDYMAGSITMHVCDNAISTVVSVADAPCPCGCARRPPGQIAYDKLLYGNAFLGLLGERIDPTTITVA